MRFWDSSAIVPLLVAEATTALVAEAFTADPAVLVWWGTSVECVSALARREREGLGGTIVPEALRRLDALASAWDEVEPVERVRSVASRLVRVHPLHAADAMQLAAALVASEAQPETLPFVTLDRRLATAAEREGFAVIGPVEA